MTPRSRIDTVLAVLDAKKTEQKRLNDRLEQVRRDIADYQQAQAILSHLSEKISQDAERQTAELATLALQETFTDQNLSLVTKHSISRGQPAVDLLMVDHDKGVQGKPRQSFGGGPSAVLGIIVRVITVMRRRGMLRTLVLDEPTAQVSAGYSGKAATVLKKICLPLDQDGLGFSALVVTHSPVLAGQANRLYRAYTGEDNYLQVEELSNE